MATSKGSDTCDSIEDEPPPLISDNGKSTLKAEIAQSPADKGQVLGSDEDEDEFDEMEDGSEEGCWRGLSSWWMDGEIPSSQINNLLKRIGT